MDTGRIFAQKSYSGARSKHYMTLWRNFLLSFFSFLPPLPILSPTPMKYAKPEMHTQAGWNTYCLTKLFLDNCLQSVKSAEISVHVSSLRPQTSKPSRFLKDHQACKSLSLINQQLPSHFLGVESALRSLMWLSYLKHKQEKKKKLQSTS